MNKVTWGILSTAHIARTQFIPAIGRAENAEVAGISSRGSKVHAAASELSIAKAYESYEELLEDSDIQAVYIPLPNSLHSEWVAKAAKSGKHVLCEKPLALNTEEALSMFQVCREADVQLMEAFMYQFHPQHKRVREIILSGEIGEVKIFKSSHSFYLANRDSDIRMVKEMGGGSLYDVGCYSIHAMRTILNEEPVRVNVIADIDSESQVDLSAYGIVKMESGITGMFDCSFDAAGRNEYEVIGTEGTIKVPYAFRPDINGNIGHVIVEKPGSVRTEKIAGDIYRAEVEIFSEAILSGKGVSHLEASTIQNMKVIDACYESIEKGSSVEVQ
ncbi:gfo/Idh/MocA family oxidoreductase [Bacillus lacus]|uniref:Gfo/Idh/MocA family oxidoreductase n=1 Tax=Metabacillus lacus TaxID=1983721 RepID=A0A7X2LZB5_9BACI|nr:Gfo/Idh/MocA family oxidoreductase [Metabacillus lacus]MRX71767.1 gfo/Idh/MocA family oxidoreductase [Metabacillus lacus]